MPGWRLFSGENAYILCMDTIIFFYKKRNLKEPLTEFKKMPGYRLIKVGISAEGENWFGHNLGQTVTEEQQEELTLWEADTIQGNDAAGLFRRFRKRFLEKRQRVEMQRRLEELLSKREAEIRSVEEQMKSMATYLTGKAGGEGACSYACEEALEKNAVWNSWLKYFPVRKFDGFSQRFRIEQLLTCAHHPQLVILGSCEDIFGIIESLACKIKSLRWFMREEDCGGEIYEFMEDFYIEYGLAITLQTVCGRSAYRKLLLTCTEPADILDFTDEPRVSTVGVARGSVWLDVFSSEEKQRRIAGRDTGIEYISLKERWRRA